MAYYKDVDANRKKKEKEAMLRFGEKAQIPVTMVVSKGQSNQNESSRMGKVARNISQGLKDAVVQSAEMQSTNQNLIATHTGETVKKAVQNTVRNLGQAALANSKAQMTAAELNRAAIQNAGRTVVKGASELSGAQADAQRSMAETIVQTAKSASNKYGEIWGMTSGVTGSDQTGASIWGYRKGQNHIGQHDETETETADKIQSQIEDGGIDALLHGLGARILSSFKTLDGYNKHLQFAATGEIQDDMTVTPGAYSEIVDEAIADYFEEQYGKFWRDAYVEATEGIDDVISAVTLGSVVNPLKSALDAAYDAMERGRDNGATDHQAVNYGVVNGLMGFAEEKVGDVVGDDLSRSLFLDMLVNTVQNGADLVAQEKVLEESSDYHRLTEHYYKKGFTKEQAERIAKNELMKNQAKDVALDTVFDSVFDRIKDRFRG